MKAGDTAVILRSELGNAGKRCRLIDLCDGAQRFWWVVVIGGTVCEGLIPEAWLQAEPERAAA